MSNVVLSTYWEIYHDRLCYPGTWMRKKDWWFSKFGYIQNLYSSVLLEWWKILRIMLVCLSLWSACLKLLVFRCDLAMGAPYSSHSYHWSLVGTLAAKLQAQGLRRRHFLLVKKCLVRCIQLLSEGHMLTMLSCHWTSLLSNHLQSVMWWVSLNCFLLSVLVVFLRNIMLGSISICYYGWFCRPSTVLLPNLNLGDPVFSCTQ